MQNQNMPGMGGTRTPSNSLRMGFPQLGQATVGVSRCSTGVVIFQSFEVMPRAVLQRYYTAGDAREATRMLLWVIVGTASVACVAMFSGNSYP